MAEDDKFKMRLSKEDLKKLQEEAGIGPEKRKSRFSSLSITYISSLIGLFIFIFLLVGIVLSYFGVGTIIHPLEAGTLKFQSSNVQEWPVLREAEQQWNGGDIQEAVLTLEMAVEEIEGRGNQSLIQEIHLANLKGLIILERYGDALRKSQALQVEFKTDRAYLADVYYYKAHAFYYLKRYLNAVQSFDKAINNGTTYMDKAEEYSSEIRDLI